MAPVLSSNDGMLQERNAPFSKTFSVGGGGVWIDSVLRLNVFSFMLSNFPLIAVRNAKIQRDDKRLIIQ